MPLILAIESDGRQAAHLVALARGQLRAKLVIAESTERAIAEIEQQIPDLILTSALLSPRDEHALAERLRALNQAAAHVQTLTIPVFAAPTKTRSKKGVLSHLRRPRKRANAPDGCDPNLFAEQIAQYLERAEAERALIDADARAANDAPETEPADQAAARLAATAPAAENRPVVTVPTDDEQAIERLVDVLFVGPAPIETSTTHLDRAVVVVMPTAVDQDAPASVVGPTPMPPYHDVEINLGEGVVRLAERPDDPSTTATATVENLEAIERLESLDTIADQAERTVDQTLEAAAILDQKIGPSDAGVIAADDAIPREADAVVPVPDAMMPAADTMTAAAEAMAPSGEARASTTDPMTPAAEAMMAAVADAPVSTEAATEPAPMDVVTMPASDFGMPADVIELVSEIDPIGFASSDGLTFEELVQLESAIMEAAVPVRPVEPAATPVIESEAAAILIPGAPEPRPDPMPVESLPITLESVPATVESVVTPAEPELEAFEPPPLPTVVATDWAAPEDAAHMGAPVDVSETADRADLSEMPEPIAVIESPAPPSVPTTEPLAVDAPAPAAAYGETTDVLAEPGDLSLADANAGDADLLALISEFAAASELSLPDAASPVTAAPEVLRADLAILFESRGIESDSNALWIPLRPDLHQLWPSLIGPAVVQAVDAPPAPSPSRLVTTELRVSAAAATRSGATRQKAQKINPKKIKKKIQNPQRPIEDEWGLFDPDRCGFAALLSKLDEITTADEKSRDDQA